MSLASTQVTLNSLIPSLGTELGLGRNQQLIHSKNLQSLPVSDHFGYAKAYAMLTRVEFFLTRSKLRKPVCEVLTRPYASEGFGYA